MAMAWLVEDTSAAAVIVAHSPAASTVGIWLDMVATSFDRLRSENMVEFVTPRILVRPLANSREHITLDFCSLITNCRVMEGPEHVVKHLVNRYARILPCVQDTSD